MFEFFRDAAYLRWVLRWVRWVNPTKDTIFFRIIADDIEDVVEKTEFLEHTLRLLSELRCLHLCSTISENHSASSPVC